MRILKFLLKGKTAFFKKPDVNAYHYYTYNNIHKVALMGIFGAILGLDGYSQQKGAYPEFYEKLKNIQVSIVPLKKEFSKKVHTFNNSTGFYNVDNKKRPCNLIFKEQWLEDPAWEIYVLLDGNEILEELADRIMNYNFKYIPYLGKNDHYADIVESEIITDVDVVDVYPRIDSLFDKRNFSISGNVANGSFGWKHEEYLPLQLDGVNNLYVTFPVVYSNVGVRAVGNALVYYVNKKFISFL